MFLELILQPSLSVGGVINHGKKNILGVLINAVDYEYATKAIIAAAAERRPLAVSALAVHGVMTGVLDSTHRYRLNNLHLRTGSQSAGC